VLVQIHNEPSRDIESSIEIIVSEKLKKEANMSDDEKQKLNYISAPNLVTRHQRSGDSFANK